MATPKETVWEISPHTRAKHQILELYLDAWLPILTRYPRRIVIMDGFSGPGEYKRGEPGSPVIILRSAAKNYERLKRSEVVFYFVDKDKQRIEHLKKVLSLRQESKIPNFTVSITEGEFHVTLTEELDILESKGHLLAPTFAFIDPFGFSGVPMELIHRLLSFERTEAFINFATESIQRFLTHPDEKIRSHIQELFGTDTVQKYAGSGAGRINMLRRLYQEQLQQVASFVRYFSMRDRNNQPIYDLFFASNHPLGHYKMKEAMWKVDPEGDYTFSDSTIPSQRVLFQKEAEVPLLQELQSFYSGQKGVPIGRIREWVKDRTAFLEQHANAALVLGQERNEIVVHPRTESGRPRRRFPEHCRVDFIRSGGIQGSLFR